MPDPTPSHPAPAPPPGTSPPPPGAPPALANAKPEVSFEEFAKIDLRIAKVVQADFHPGADRLLRLQVDDNPEPIAELKRIVEKWNARRPRSVTPGCQ